MARPEKVAQVEAVAAAVKEARSVILVDFTGLTVEKVSALRKICRENNVHFKVVKNTLAMRGLKGTTAEGLTPYFGGTTAMAVSSESESLPAKILGKFAEEHEAKIPTFKAGYVDGTLMNAAGVLALSKLPSREEMLSKMLGSLMAPGNGLVSCLQGPLRNLVGVLGQIKDQKS